MDNDTATTVITIFFALSTVSFLLLIVGLFRPSWVTRRPSLQTRKGVFLIYGLFVVFFTGGWLFVASIAEPTSDFTTDESFIYYTGAQGANIRECPALSCKVVDTIPPNTKLTFSRNPFDKNPDWAEYVFPDDSVGYVSKIALPENPVSASPPPSVGGSSSVGGITIGPWNNIQTIVGESYEFHFCEPPSAISGATCGSLADTATNPKGGRPPYSFIKKSGFLPPGMTLELNGTLKGAPTQEGTYNFRLCAKDLYGGEGCQNLVVVVKKEEKTSPTPIDVVSPTLTENIPISIEITGGTCRFIRNLQDSDGDVYLQLYTAEFRGTASGPVGSIIWFRGGGGNLYDQYGIDESWNKFESSWPEDEYYRGDWKRGANDPPTAEWKYTRNNNAAIGFPSKGYYTLVIEIRAPRGEPSKIEKELRVDCP